MSLFCFVQLLVVSAILGAVGYYVEPHLWLANAPAGSVLATGLFYGCIIGGLGVALRSKCASKCCSKATSPKAASGENITVYVGNLPFSVKDADLAEAFSATCTVISARVVTAGRGGRSKGYGFVDVDSASSKDALAMNGQEIDGRVIRVNVAKDKSSDEES